MKIAILYDRIAETGAYPDQSDVLEQANAVGRALEDLGHESMRFALTMDMKALMRELKRLKPDLVFNLVESVEGHGRLIHLVPTVLELLGVPYTGSSADTLYMTSNKIIAKKVLEGAGIRTPQSFLANGLDHGNTLPKGPYIIKSIWEHASIGLDEDSVLRVEDPQQLFSELGQRTHKLGGACFAESYIEGREFNLSLLASYEGQEVLPPAEIRFHNYPEDKWRIVDYKAKWDHASFEYDHTCRSFEIPGSDQPLLLRLGTLAKKCWELFDVRGYARVDFRVDKDNQPWVLEINTNPCLSPDAGFVAAAFQKGLEFNQVIERIIRHRIH
jgi:D-alanine-D-alanine ligase